MPSNADRLPVPPRAVAALAVLLAVVLALPKWEGASASAFTRSAPAVQPPVAPAGTSAAPRWLDGLREQAQLGNTRASADVARALLDRYERQHDAQALMEAAQWFDRDWSSEDYLRTDVSTRLVADGCGHPVLRWHWLCLTGE